MRPVPVGVGAGFEPRNIVPQRRDYQRQSLLRGHAVRRSRRGLLARLLKPGAVALALVAVPTAAVAWLMVSPRFAVHELAIVTGDRVPEAWVREALAPVVGENLPRLPLARAELLLRSHPWVRGADLRKDLPVRLAVRVAERRAVAMLRAGDELYYLDAEGVRIAPFDPLAGRADLPLISVANPRQTESPAAKAEAASAAAPGRPKRDRPASSDPSLVPNTDRRGEATGLASAVRMLSEIDEVEPTWAAGLSEIEVLGEDDFRVHTAVLPFPVLVRTGTLNLRARRLEELLPHIFERFGAVAAVDLRFARRIIVQPSVESGAGRSLTAPKTEYIKATSDHAQRG